MVVVSIILALIIQTKTFDNEIKHLNNIINVDSNSKIEIKNFDVKDFAFRDKSNHHDFYDQKDDGDDYLQGLDKDELKYEKDWNYNFKQQLKINDILYNGKSIIKTSLGEINPNFSNDKNIELVLKGNFKIWKPIRLKDMSFSYQDVLLQQLE